MAMSGLGCRGSFKSIMLGSLAVPFTLCALACANAESSSSRALQKKFMTDYSKVAALGKQHKCK
jgi:hypothetical protein